MQINIRVKSFLVALLILVMIFSYLINRFIQHPEPPKKQAITVDSLYYSDQEKIDSYNRTKREEALSKQKRKAVQNTNEKRTQLTIDGWDPATKSIIDPINLWKNYENRTYAGTVRHGEKVTLIKQDGDGILIETKSGVQGWVTYFFIKEFSN